MGVMSRSLFGFGCRLNPIGLILNVRVFVYVWLPFSIHCCCHWIWWCMCGTLVLQIHILQIVVYKWHSVQRHTIGSTFTAFKHSVCSSTKCIGIFEIRILNIHNENGMWKSVCLRWFVHLNRSMLSCCVCSCIQRMCFSNNAMHVWGR